VGGHLWIVSLVQAALAAASLVLLWSLARRLGGTAGAAVAVALVLLYGPHQLFTASLLSEALVMPVVLTFLHLFLDRRWPALQVVLLGYGYLLRPNLLLFILLLLLWLLAVDKARCTRLAWVLLFLLPIPLLHWATTGSLIVTSAQSGTALYLGNHPGCHGLFTNDLGVRGDMQQMADQVIAIARAETARDLSPAEVNRYWTGRAIAWARHEPLAFANNVVLKLLRMVDTHEYATDHQWLPDFPSAARLFPVPFALIAALAAAGLPGLAERRTMPLLLYLAGGVASLLIYYPSSRHRYLLLPVLALLAARGVDALRRRRPTAWMLAIFVLVLSVVGVPDERRAPDPFALFNRARAFVATGELSRGRAFLDRAMAIRPDVPFFHVLEAEIEEQRGHPEAARRALVMAFLLGEDDVGVINRLGRSALERRQWHFAERVFRRAIELYPDSPASYMNLAQALLADGDPEEAARWYHEAVRRGSRRRPDMEATLRHWYSSSRDEARLKHP
jgi:Tfp pilus assembly protein PilF